VGDDEGPNDDMEVQDVEPDEEAAGGGGGGVEKREKRRQERHGGGGGERSRRNHDKRDARGGKKKGLREKTELKMKAPNELQLFPENSGRTATGPEAAAICCVQRNRGRPDAG